MRKTIMTCTLALGVVGTLAALTLPASASSAVVRAPGGASVTATVSTACPDVAHHEDAVHDGYNCSSVSAEPNQLWSDTLDGSVGYPVIAGGRVFVTTGNDNGPYGGNLYALNAKTGKILWGPIALPGTYWTNNLAYDNGEVFVSDFDGTIRAFEATTGAQLWSTATNYYAGEPVVSKGIVWVNGDYAMYGLSETTGAITATSTAYLDGDQANPAVNSSGIYLSTGCNTQYKLSLTGAVVWDDLNGCTGGGGGTTALADNRMYGGQGDKILAPATGKLEGTYTGIPAFTGATGVFANGTTVSALDTAEKNATLWTSTLPAPVVDGPIVTPSAVWVATSDSILVSLDPGTGEVLHTIALPGVPGTDGSHNTSDIGIGNNIVVVPTGSTVTAFG